MMKRALFVGAAFGAVMAMGLPFIGGAAPSAGSIARAETSTQTPIAASAPSTSADAYLSGNNIAAHAYDSPQQDGAAVQTVAERNLATDTEHLAQKPVPKPVVVDEGSSGGSTASGSSRGTKSAATQARVAAKAATGVSCPANVGGSTAGAPGRNSAGGVSGTTTADIQSFAEAFNAIRVANCLEPIPMSNFRYDSCMEQRLFWIAEDPSDNVLSAWGHNGTQRSDGLPAVGCDGNLAGGSGNTGATVAQKWWNSAGHQKSLYRPTFSGSTSGVTICFAMTHGGLPNDGYGFTRAAARWGGC